MFLMTSTRGRLLVLGVDPFAGVRCTGFADGDCLWNLSLGQRTGDGKFDGETFWVGCGWFFLEGVGEGKRRLQDTFSMHLQTIVKGPPVRDALGIMRTLFNLRQPVDLFHTLKTVKGLLHLVPSRTPRRSGYGVLSTCGLCYMLFLLYV